MARTAIQAVAMVSSLVDTQESIVMEPPGEVRVAESSPSVLGDPARRCRLPGRRRGRCRGAVAQHHRRQQARLPRARRRRTSCTKKGASEKVQFAIVPADAEPVEPRLTIDGPTDLRQPRPGAVRHRSFAGAELVGLVGRPQQPRHRPEELRRSVRDRDTAAADVREVSATCARPRRPPSTSPSHRLGFDAQLKPGDVIIDELVCLKASDDGRTMRRSSRRPTSCSILATSWSRSTASRCRWSTTSPRSCQAQARRQREDRLRARRQSRQRRGRADRRPRRARSARSSASSPATRPRSAFPPT